MVDTGANVSLVSAAFIQRSLKGEDRPKKEPYMIKVADRYEPIDHEIRTARIGYQNGVSVMDMDVMEGMIGSCLLGLDWLDQTGYLIDPRNRTLIQRTPRMEQYAQRVWVRTTHRPYTMNQVNRMVKHDNWKQEMKQDMKDTQDEYARIPSEYKDYADIFKNDKTITALPKHQPWDHFIPLEEGTKPIKAKIYPLSRNQEIELQKYIQENKAKGFIRESTSPWGFPILFVPKKDGTLRLCVDYRQLNKVTKKNSYPLPLISELQDRLQGSEWFTALDLRGAYNLIRMGEGEEEKTAFRTRYGTFEYCVMPFGLTNAPASCQALVNDALSDGLDIFVVAYLDDILVFSKTREEHVKHVRWVMEKLRERELKLKLEKCEFFQSEVPFLGSIVGRFGIKPDPAKIKSVVEWPEPKNLKELQSFLGLANYYRRFIEGYSRITIPLTALTKKDTNFYLDETAKAAIKRLKELFTEAPILVCFDLEKKIVVETDASGFAIAAVISQPDGKNRLRPVAYYSRKMTPVETNYPIHDMELLAIVDAIKQWKVYLEGSKYPVDIFTDHLNLTHWSTSKELSKRQIRWAELMAPYKIRIYHVKGTENARADALSRRPDYAEGKEKTTKMQLLKQEGDALIPAQPLMVNTMEKQDSLSADQKQKILKICHDDRTAGHFGIEKTIERITRQWTWPGLRKDVQDHVGNCDLCSRSKASRHKPYGKLQTNQPPDGAWEEITMDFVGPLPTSRDPATGQQYDMIYVVIDRLTKYAYFIPTRNSTTAEQLAYTFMRFIFAHHGMPSKLISDRDKLFRSKFWQSLMDQLGSKNKLSTAFHPQTDGQTERTNQTLEQYLRAYVNHEQTNWVELLPLAQVAYNSSKVATGISPFYANYGFHPNVHQEPLNIRPEVPKATIKVSKLKELHQLLSAELSFLAERMARFANKGRSEGPDFKEGGTAYLLRTNIKTKRPSSKLDFKKLGPFKIEKKLGPVTYKLKLPKDMKIHPVFHVALLEKAPTSVRTVESLPTEPQEELEYDIETVLAGRLNKQGNPEYLIKWTGYDATHDSWEPEANLTPDTLTEIREQHPEWYPLTKPLKARKRKVKHWVK